MKHYEQHPASSIMPPYSDDDYADLVESIKRDGLIEPIKILDGKIIDGNHREKACFDAGVEPRYEEVQPEDPHSFVMSTDTRRHMTKKKRASVWIELRKQGKSYREIAELDGDVSKSTVQRSIVPNGTVDDELPDTVVGKDGKKRKAKKPAKPATKDEQKTTDSPTKKPPKKKTKKVYRNYMLDLVIQQIDSLENGEGYIEALDTIINHCKKLQEETTK